MAKYEEAAQRRRRGMVVAVAVLLTMLSGAYAAFSETDHAMRLVDAVKAAAFLLLAAIITLRSTTSFNVFGRSSVLDDELTQANRALAARTGFFALMIALAGCFVAGLLTPLSLSQAAPLLIAVGASAAALRFSRLERRGDA